MADLTFRWNRKAMMLYGSGESSIPAHAKRGTIHGVAGSRDLRNAVLAARENGSSWILFGYNADRASLHWNNWSY